MDDMSTFERRLAAGLNAYAGPRQAIDPLRVVRSARARSAATPNLGRWALPAARPWPRLALSTTARLIVILATLALATGLLVLAGAPRPTPTPTPPTDGALVIERFAFEFVEGAPGGTPPRELVLVTLDGSLTTLTPAERSEACPSFSPDGGRLAFFSAERLPDAPIENYELAVADAAAGAPRTFLMPGFVDPQEHSAPSWAPDGSALVAVLQAPDNPHPFGDLIVVPLDGSPPRTLLRASREALGEPPAGLDRLMGATWSPDGKWIAFRGEFVDPDDSYGYFVAVVRPDGTDLRLLDKWEPTGAGEWGAVVWAPDSRSIAYHRLLVNHMDLYVADLDGAVRAYPATGEQFVAEWSPDGTRIATVGLTRDPVQILDAASGDVSHSFDIKSGAATWSARGDRLAIQEAETGRLWVMQADGSGEPELLTTGTSPLCWGMGPVISWQELRP